MFTSDWLIEAMMGDKIIVRHCTKPTTTGIETRCFAICYWAEDIASYGLVIEYRHYEGKRSGLQPLKLHPLSGDQNSWLGEVQQLMMPWGSRYWWDPEEVICALPDRTVGPAHHEVYPHLNRFQAAVAITRHLSPDGQEISLGIAADRLEGLIQKTKKALALLTEGKN